MFRWIQWRRLRNAPGMRFQHGLQWTWTHYQHQHPITIQHQLDDQAIFPTKPGVPFPPNFRDVCGNIFRRLFRVYAHVYHSHHERVVELTVEAHLNSCFVSVPRRFFLPFFTKF